MNSDSLTALLLLNPRYINVTLIETSIDDTVATVLGSFCPMLCSLTVQSAEFPFSAVMLVIERCLHLEKLAIEFCLNPLRPAANLNVNTSMKSNLRCLQDNKLDEFALQMMSQKCPLL